MKELGDAINESLSDSDRIAAAIGEIKRAGYDVFLVLEATIGFNKREDKRTTAQDEGETVELEPRPNPAAAGEQDQAHFAGSEVPARPQDLDRRREALRPRESASHCASSKSSAIAKA